jgi:NADPH:quinone reductase-like Zn-dependent oxidoreductase
MTLAARPANTGTCGRLGHMSVRAVVADPQAKACMRAAEVGVPVPGPRQVVVAAHHVSLNRGDLNDARSGRVPAGSVLGSDVAGVVVRAAAEGGGPPVGARVVALTAGAFANRVAVDVDALAKVPDGVDLAEAAALPVAGVAAMQALRVGSLETPVKGSRVLVTGAAGGVGRFAVQLAAYAGAHVIATVGNPDRAAELAGLGADQVVTEVGEIDEQVDLVLDNVGGPQLAQAWELLAVGGNVQSIGWSSGEPATFQPYATVGPAKSLTSFLITTPVGPDLSTLVRLVEAGSLRVGIAWRGPLSRIAEAADAMLARRLSGKAVLDLTQRQR